MKFSEIPKDQWSELQPYLDTCLLPLTGLTGGESPWRAADTLHRLQDVMDLIEIPFRGRVVTYPALHYLLQAESFKDAVNQLVAELKQVGFKYVFVATGDTGIARIAFEGVDLLISEKHFDLTKEGFSQLIQSCWEKL